MYIDNYNEVSNKKYVCNSIIGNYLLKNNFPLLSREDKRMVFARNSKLEKFLNDMPLILKMLGGIK